MELLLTLVLTWAAYAPNMPHIADLAREQPGHAGPPVTWSILNRLYGQIESIRDRTVLIETKQAQGTGVLFSRTHGKANLTYIWTAGHVVSLLLPGERPVAVLEWRRNGGEILKARYVCEVVKASFERSSRPGFGTTDLAILRVCAVNALPEAISVNFPEEGSPPPKCGACVYHVGSFLGAEGALSLSHGIISYVGRRPIIERPDVEFDQTTAPIFPGSSGGGIFLASSFECIGIVTTGYVRQGLSYYVPVRRMRTWADRNGCAFALDRSVDIPNFALPKELSDGT